MNSCLYEGQVRHRRHSPKKHIFNYKLFFVYLDLDELESVFDRRWFWSTKRRAIAQLKRSDYIGNNNVSIKNAVIQRIKEETGVTHTGNIKVLTHLRYFGYNFNPVTFYYCYSETGEAIDFIVAEITNTPWGERHSYVLNNKEKRNKMRFSLAKDFHVSPFMPMQLDYDWRFSTPNDALNVHMINTTTDGNEQIFDATLKLKKRPISFFNCARAITLFPFVTVKVIVGIYWQALRLYIKKTPLFTHPDKISNDINGGVKQTNHL